jgi:hypothetical protein
MVGKEPCPCGRCHDWHLTGIGKFVQGSGFTEEEADRIIAALNAAANQPLSDSVKARAREILNRHTEYMDGLARGQVTMKTSNALAAVEEALASAAIPSAGGVEEEDNPCSS